MVFIKRVIDLPQNAADVTPKPDLELSFIKNALTLRSDNQTCCSDDIPIQICEKLPLGCVQLSRDKDTDTAWKSKPALIIS